jgi:putative ubiquitin-RnfH superfamily antitoxin RatB of RatAB toxin-antitoxin module
MSAPEISIEIVYALPGHQVLRRLSLPAGSSIIDAIRASSLLAEFPKIDLSRVGIHGRLAQPDARLRDGDRVEIYRPLQGDPKDVRRKRAQRRGK